MKQLLLSFLIALLGCNRAPSPPATAPSTQAATKLPPLGALQCKLAVLALARGTVVPAGKTLWFWLHHSDGSAMFQLKPGEFPRDGEIHLPKPTVLRSEDGTLTMSRADFMKLSPGAGDSMLLLDEWTAALWKIDVTGAADVVQALERLPKLLTTPAANRMGDMMLFSA